MIVTRSTRETSIFVMHAADLDRLVDVVSSDFPSLSFIASCSDKAARNFSTLEELKGYQNPERAKIEELEIRGRNLENDHSVRMQFDTDAFINSKLSFSTSEEVARKVEDAYADALDSMRPWYAVIATLNWLLLLGGLVILVFAALVGYVTFQTGKSPVRADQFFSVKSLLPAATGLLSGWVIMKLQARYFPGGTFAIGDGKRRHDRDEVLRTTIIAGFGISVLASIFWGFF